MTSPAGGSSGAASLRKDGSTGPPFRRVLVANRGEIAVRIIRACRALGMEVVAVYSDADVTARHVELADEAVRLGPAPPAESYLRADAVVAAALASGAEAIHPGYGFLSERAAFARAVEDAGLAFVGPASGVIAALGDKLAARRLAGDAGVAVVPGTLEPASLGSAADLPAIVEAAREVGYPLLVKAAAGGGGRGMRRVERPQDLPAALLSGSAEAAAAFGDGSVYVEREIRPARHVEVQLLGDLAGTIVALGERDCSLQRRHQKLVEESPAPGLTSTERAELHQLAIRIAQGAGLTNAATAEFLLDTDRRPWFLEVNTRLQVEHGVTELVGGLDLVAEQFSIAAGRPLSAAALAAAHQAASPPRHAIEVRLAAEDPARGFTAAPGRIERWSMPQGAGIRIDDGVRSGDRVPPEYDPLVGKLLVVAQDREAAIRRLREALDGVAVTGIQTTLPFHRFVARDPGFAAGDVSTDWVAERWDGHADRARALLPARLAAGRAAAGAAPVIHSRPPVAEAADSRWRLDGREALLDRWPQ